MFTIAQVPQDKDLEILMGGYTYSVSKFLFAAYCKLLQDRTVLEARYEVSEKFNPDIFGVFCNACQCQPYHVSDENVEELRRIAQFFGCQSVIDDCDRLDTGPIGLICRAISAKGKDTEAHEEALKNVAENLKDCLLSDKMFSLSADQIVRIFDLCDESIDDATIVDFVLKYARRHQDKKVNVGNALKKVPLERLFKISAESLKELINREQFPDFVSGEQVFKILLPLLNGKPQSVRPPAPRPDETERQPAVPSNMDSLWGQWQYLEIWSQPTRGLLQRYGIGQKQGVDCPAVFVCGEPNFNEIAFKKLFTELRARYEQECSSGEPWIQIELPYPAVIYGIVWSGTDNYRPDRVTIEAWETQDETSQVGKITDDRPPNYQTYRVLVEASETSAKPLFRREEDGSPVPVTKIRFTQHSAWNSKDRRQANHNNLGLGSFEIHGVPVQWSGA